MGLRRTVDELIDLRKDFRNAPSVAARARDCQEVSDPERLCADPEVSVLIRAYRCERTIGRALESVFAQRADFPFEVIVSDDASPDGTRAILLDWQRRHPERMRVLWSDANVGNMVNSVRVQTWARGRWVAELDGDDYWLTDTKLQRQHDLAVSQHCVGCVSRFVWKDVRTGETSIRPEEPIAKAVLAPAEVAAHYFQMGTLFYARSAYERIARACPYTVEDDVSKPCLLAGCGKIAFLDEPTAIWHVGASVVFSSLDALRQAQEIVFSAALLFLYGPRAARKVQAKRFREWLRVYLALCKEETAGLDMTHLRLFRSAAWQIAWACLPNPRYLRMAFRANHKLSRLLRRASQRTIPKSV